MLISIGSFSQVSFDKFPQNLQLYPRDISTNTGTVPINGTVTEGGYEKVILTVLKNNAAYQTQERTINYINSAYSFSFEVNINAELSEYSFQLSLSKGGTAKLVKQADRIVCGDVLLLYGQSNMIAIPGVDDFNATVSDQFMRNYDFPFADDQNPNDLQWYSSKMPYAHVGTIGCYLQKLMADKHHLPTCVINASSGGRNISELSERDPANHFSPNNFYGRMMLRIKNGGYLNSVRAMAFRHGENEAATYYLYCNQYPEKFDVFYKELMEDLPSIQKMYIIQNNILNEAYVERAGFLRDFQRRTKQIYPKIETLSSVGTVAYVAPHYNAAGYIQTANELFRLIDRDFYGSADVNQINAPDIKSAYFNDQKNELTLVFDDDQQMIYPKDSVFSDHIRSMKDFFFLNSNNQAIDFNESNHPVIAGRAEGNKIILTLASPSNDTYVTYLPSTFSDNYSPFYDGVHLKNARGMRAFSFYEIPIGGASTQPTITPTNPTVPDPVVSIPTPTTPTNTTPVIPTIPMDLPNVPAAPANLTAKVISKAQINLEWTDNSTNETRFVVERSVDNSNFFSIGNVDANMTTALSKDLFADIKYYYRVKACNDAGCSAYSNVTSATTNVIDATVAATQPSSNPDNPCVSLTLSADISSGDITFDGLEINAANKILANSKAIYKSLKTDLNPGFDADMGSDFEAIVGGCGNAK